MQLGVWFLSVVFLQFAACQNGINCPNLEALVDKFSKLLESYRFGIVNPPSCPSFENIARLQVPALRTYCEMNTLGGGWIVIQQRLDGSLDFNRNWADYRAGFGTAGRGSEFWLGLEAIYWITNSAQYELAVEVKDENGRYAYLRYTEFKVASEAEKYWLSLGKYSGSTYDALNFVHAMSFSTYDQSNDSNRRCANQFSGGWWYVNTLNAVCTISNLNGPFRKAGSGKGIYWSGFTEAGTYSRMMIRRK